MAASDFETITVPNLGAFGRLSTIHVKRTDLNVGANATGVLYTAPAGRLAVVTVAGIMHTGGTAPARLILWVRDSGGTVVNDVVNTNAFAVLDESWVQGVLVIPAGYDLQYRTVGGDATTDIEANCSGFVVDWSDFDA